ncbi:MAG TPA: PEGA domain-containing protein [Candidatus Kapabacteria bacterium]|nr:PEGA domain-containing protein [Candidatus Kapabacteria bacterium]
MSYPRIFLTKPIRRLIMVFLFMLFFLIAPLVLFYTAGYRYDVENKTIQQTGVISIDVEPNDAAVYLNTVRIDRRMPLRLANRAPGTYHIRIEKEGYKTWEKDITVSSRKTTYIKDITLFRDSLPVPFLTTDVFIDRFSASHDGNHILFSTPESQLQHVYLLDTRTRKKTLLSRDTIGNIPHIDWSPWYAYALLVTSQPSGRILHFIDGGNEGIIQTMPLPANTTTLIYQWNKNMNIPSLFFQNGKNIMQLTRSGNTTHTSLPEKTSAWYIDEDGHLWVYDRTAQLISSTVLLDPVRNVPSDIIRFIDINKRRIIVQTPTSVVVIPRTEDMDTITVLPTQHILFSPESDEWISWSPSEIWTIFTDGSTTLVTRTGDEIATVSPLDRTGSLLLVHDTRFVAYNPGYETNHELFRNGRVYDLGVNTRNRKIYFLGEVGQKKNIFELNY